MPFQLLSSWQLLGKVSLRIGMVDHYMIFGIKKLNARKFRKKKQESLKPEILVNMIRNLSETT